MAMLQLDDVVAQTWGDRVGPTGAVPYWREVTGAVQALHPNFLFVAEAYWDREPDLIAQGFDHCYDKRLYDRLVSDGAGLGAGSLGGRSRIPAALGAVPGKPRRASGGGSLPRGPWGGGRRVGRHRTGRTSPVPRSVRRPPAPHARPTRAVARRAAECGPGGPVAPTAGGCWRKRACGLDGGALLEVSGWPDNDSCRNLLAWQWEGEHHRHLVVVNFSDTSADGRSHWKARPGPTGISPTCSMASPTGGRALTWTRPTGGGLYVSRGPFGAHLFRLARIANAGGVASSSDLE